MKSLRAVANEVRVLALTDVALFLGGEQAKHDKQRWDFDGCSVWFGKGQNSHRFYDHHAGRGGGGAIDLAIHVLNCDFKAAVAALSPLVGAEPPGQSRPAPQAGVPADFAPPTPCPKYSGLLREYLTVKRALPLAVVEPALADGRIHADTRRNAVFLCHDGDGKLTGAELRGTGPKPFKGMATGSRRGVGFFTLAHATPERLVVVESALDALAYRALFPHELATIVSTAGVLSSCPALEALATSLGVAEVMLAYDNDAAGEAAATALATELSRRPDWTIRRRIPWGGKDWNDMLMHPALSDELYRDHVPEPTVIRQMELEVSA